MSYTAPALQTTTTAHDHFVQFYDRDDFLVDEVSDFLDAGLQAGQAVIVFATPQHRADLEQRLSASTFVRNRYIALDAAATLAKIMVDDWPDEQRFEAGPTGRQSLAQG